MAFVHRTITAAFPATTDASAAWVSDPVDCLRVVSASAQFTLASVVGTPSVAIALQVSNAVPAAGNIDWAPPEASWVQAYSGGAAISSTMIANGTVVLGLAADGLLCRWVRAVATPSGAASGGTLTVDFFSRDTGS